MPKWQADLRCCPTHICATLPLHMPRGLQDSSTRCLAIVCKPLVVAFLNDADLGRQQMNVIAEIVVLSIA